MENFECENQVKKAMLSSRVHKVCFFQVYIPVYCGVCPEVVPKALSWGLVLNFTLRRIPRSSENLLVLPPALSHLLLPCVENLEMEGALRK